MVILSVEVHVTFDILLVQRADCGKFQKETYISKNVGSLYKSHFHDI